MGRGKCWSREESEAVAKAWKLAASIITSPREHNTKRFAAELYHQFVQLSPDKTSSSVDGRWTSRSQTAVKTQFDAIGDDILKFNAVLLSVAQLAAARRLNIDHPHLIRASIAVHLGSPPIPNQLDFDNIETVETDWKLYEAWRILKTCPQYAPLSWSSVTVLDDTPVLVTHSRTQPLSDRTLSLSPDHPPLKYDNDDHDHTPQDSTSNGLSVEPEPSTRIYSTGYSTSRAHPLAESTPARTTPPRTTSPRITPPRTTPPRTTPSRTTPPRTTLPHTTPLHTPPHRTTPPRTVPPRTAPPRTAPPRTKTPPRTAPPRTKTPPRTTPPCTTPPRATPPHTTPPRTTPPRTTLTRTTPTRTTPTRTVTSPAISVPTPVLPPAHALSPRLSRPRSPSPLPHCIAGLSAKPRTLISTAATRIPLQQADHSQPHSNGVTSHRVKRRLPDPIEVQPEYTTPSRPKVPRLSSSFQRNDGESAIQMVAQSIQSLSDALSEYNAITLFSQPEMQGTRDQKLFFHTLAEKHLLKAELARDGVSRQLNRRRSREDQVTSHGKLVHYKQ